MNTLPTTTLINTIVELLSEAYEGPVNPQGTWFIDNTPNSGILGVIAGITSVEASTSVDGSRKAGTTIAANVEHLRWSLANVNATVRGDAWNPDWGVSWDVLRVDQNKWDQLRAALRMEFETLRDGIKKQEQLEGDYLNGLIAVVPHAAFHLGLIRQMLERVRMPTKPA
jgi:hypothetical protein